MKKTLIKSFKYFGYTLGGLTLLTALFTLLNFLGCYYDKIYTIVQTLFN